MKSAVIFYHKNILKLYKQSWIDDCLNSIEKQTYKDYDVFELNYGGGIDLFATHLGVNYFSFFKKFKNYAGAMNFLITKIFNLKYDVIFNVNMDDVYHHRRFEAQLKEIENGYQLVSSNFLYTNENGNEITREMNMTRYGDIGQNLSKNHNVIAHPVVCMHSSFWDSDLHYNENKTPAEDLDLWQRAFEKGKKFKILDDYLLFYRIHTNQVSTKK